MCTALSREPFMIQNYSIDFYMIWPKIMPKICKSEKPKNLGLTDHTEYAYRLHRPSCFVLRRFA